jgi:hypoxanthine phosphoribosyltransferase
MSVTATASVMIPADALRGRIVELASEIVQAYPPHSPLHLVCVLKGGFIFMADLVRHLVAPVTLDFIAVSSYAKGTTTSGEVKLVKDLDSGIQGKDVIVIEDIIDTGLTLSYLLEILKAREPRSLRTACLLNKPSRRIVDVRVDFVGFTIEDRFVVGFGLDFEGHYRHLPYIGTLDAGEPPSHDTSASR